MGLCPQSYRQSTSTTDHRTPMHARSPRTVAPAPRNPPKIIPNHTFRQAEMSRTTDKAQYPQEM